MKKWLLFVVVCLIGFSPAALAQDQAGFEVGAQNIVAATKLYCNALINQNHSYVVGLGRSLYVQYNTAGNFSVRAEPGFEQKGSQIDMLFFDANGNQIGQGEGRILLGYFTLPVLARYTFGTSKLKYFVNAGPYVGYLSGSSTSLSIGPGGGGGGNFMDIQDFKEWDAGISAGAGLIIPIKDVLLISVEARDNLGLYNISRTPVIGNGTIQTNSICLLIGLGYRFGH